MNNLSISGTQMLTVDNSTKFPSNTNKSHNPQSHIESDSESSETEEEKKIRRQNYSDEESEDEDSKDEINQAKKQQQQQVSKGVKAPLSPQEVKSIKAEIRKSPTNNNNDKTNNNNTNKTNSNLLTEDDLFNMTPLSFDNTAPKNPSNNPATESKSSTVMDLAANVSYKPRQHIVVEQSNDLPATEVFCLCYSNDSRYLAAGCGDGTIRIYAQTGKIAYTLKHNYNNNNATSASSTLSIENNLPITCIRFRPPTTDSKLKHVLLSVCADGSVSHWHISSETCLFQFYESENQLYACDYSIDGLTFATAGRDAKIRIYENSTKHLDNTLGGGQGAGGHSNRIYSLKYHSTDPNILLSAGWDNTVQIWNLTTFTAVKSFYGPHICGDGLDVSPQGNRILTGSWIVADSLQLWDYESLKLIKTLDFTPVSSKANNNTSAEMLYAAKFSHDGTIIAAGGYSGSNIVKLFDSTTYKLIDQISIGTGGCYAIAFAPNNKKFATAGAGPEIVVLDL